MNKVERLTNAFNGKPVDRVPFSFWYHYQNDRLGNDNGLKAHMDYYKSTGVDYIKIMSDGYDCPAMYDVKVPSDWRHIKHGGKNSDYYKGQLDRAKRINDTLQGDCLTFYNIFAPFSLIRHCDREEMVMAHLKEDSKSVLAGLDVIAEDALELSQALMTEGGCAGIYMALQGGEKNRFTTEEYAQIVAPSDLKVLAGAKEVRDMNIAHLCGWAGDANNLEVWKDYPAKAFNWAIFIENMDLIEGRKFFGGKTVIGGFDNRRGHMLHSSGTREEIKEFTKKTVLDYKAAFGNTNGLVIGADCTIWYDVDATRFRWVLEALEEL